MLHGHVKLSIWVINYDHDPDQTYLFTCPDKAYADIMGSVRAYAFPHESEQCPALTAVIERLGEELRQRWYKPYLPIRFHNLFIDLRRIDMDRNDDLHKLLLEIYEALVDSHDPNNKRLSAMIRKLFVSVG